LVSGQLAVKHVPDNHDFFNTLGLIYKTRGSFAEAEEAQFQA
jgi:Flp pilus assembly protein TadD